MQAKRALAAGMLRYVLLVLLGVSWSPPVEAFSRDEILRELDRLPRTAEGTLEVAVDSATPEGTPIGAPLSYRVRSAEPMHLTVLHVDPNGVITVLYPSRALGSASVRPGLDTVLPDPESEVRFTGEMPIGLESLIVVATSVPLDPDALSIAGTSSWPAVVDPEDAIDFARSLESSLKNLGRVETRRLDHRVLPRPEGALYRASEIVGYFSSRSRALRRPRLDLQIHFAFESANLDASARRDLDEFGDALNHEQLRAHTFLLSGHTDDVGPQAFNLELSRRRAESVKQYLVSRHEVPARRIRIEFFGESRPREPNDTAQGRSMNRRVEFALLK